MRLENQIEIGDCCSIMRAWIAAGVRVQMCVTSPPYWGLRDYGITGQLGLEATAREYVASVVEVCGLVRDLLTDDGTLWLNLGDTYTSSGGPGRQGENGRRLKPKNLCGIPWSVAFALQDEGWYLRADIIWSKPNPMPESVIDRPTRAHEYLFLLAKSERYFYDAEAIKEPALTDDIRRPYAPGQQDARGNGHARRAGHAACLSPLAGTRRNRRSVWTIATEPYDGAHFAAFPQALVAPCILAGSRPGDIVLDPFMGSGTTAKVAQRLGRRYLGCEINLQYARLQDERLRDTAGMPL